MLGKRTAAEIESAHRNVAEGLKRWRGLWTTRVYESFGLSPKCHYCDQKPTQRIAVNVWGNGIERDVCDAHAHYHGSGQDS